MNTQKFAHVYADRSYANPDYARFVALVNFSNGNNPKGYARYFSLDYDRLQTDEQNGLEKLITFVKSIPAKDFRLATIYANLTLDLSTSSKNYNFKVACYKPLDYGSRGGVQIRNIWQKKTVVFMQIGNNRKADINATLTLAAADHSINARQYLAQNNY